MIQTSPYTLALAFTKLLRSPRLPLAHSSLCQHQQRQQHRNESSVPAGVTLKGINIFNGGKDPVSLADDAYPAWLWTLRESETTPAVNAGLADKFEKKTLRAKSKDTIRLNSLKKAF